VKSRSNRGPSSPSSAPAAQGATVSVEDSTPTSRCPDGICCAFRAVLPFMRGSSRNQGWGCTRLVVGREPHFPILILVHLRLPLFDRVQSSSLHLGHSPMDSARFPIVSFKSNSADQHSQRQFVKLLLIVTKQLLSCNLPGLLDSTTSHLK